MICSQCWTWVNANVCEHGEQTHKHHVIIRVSLSSVHLLSFCEVYVQDTSTQVTEVKVSLRCFFTATMFLFTAVWAPSEWMVLLRLLFALDICMVWTV